MELIIARLHIRITRIAAPAAPRPRQSPAQAGLSTQRVIRAQENAREQAHAWLILNGRP